VIYVRSKVDAKSSSVIKGEEWSVAF